MSKGTALLLCQGAIAGSAFAYATSSPWFFAGCALAGLMLAQRAKDDPPPIVGHGQLTWSDRVTRQLDLPFGDRKG